MGLLSAAVAEDLDWEKKTGPTSERSAAGRGPEGGGWRSLDSWSAWSRGTRAEPAAATTRPECKCTVGWGRAGHAKKCRTIWGEKKSLARVCFSRAHAACLCPSGVPVGSGVLSKRRRHLLTTFSQHRQHGPGWRRSTTTSPGSSSVPGWTWRFVPSSSSDHCLFGPTRMELEPSLGTQNDLTNNPEPAAWCPNYGDTLLRCDALRIRIPHPSPLRSLAG